MSHKDNAEHLGKGSGVNLSSKKPSSGHGGSPGRSPDAPRTPGPAPTATPGDGAPASRPSGARCGAARRTTSGRGL